MKFRVIIRGKLSSFNIARLPERLAAGASILFPSTHQRVVVERIDREERLIYARLPA